MRPNRQHVSPPTSIALAIATTMSTLVMDHLAFGRVTMHVFTCGIRRRAAAVAAATQPRQLGRHRDPVLHRPGPVPGASGRVEEEQMGFFAHLRSDCAAVASRHLGVCHPVASGVGGRVAAHSGPDDEGTGIRLLPGLGVLRVAGHHRTRSFRCASRSSTNRATATFPECGRSSCLPRWRGWACGAGPRHT